jgi:hypothetical protein
MTRQPRRGLRALRRVARGYGYDLVRRDFYSPVPRVPPADHPVWAPSALPGVTLDTATHLRFLETELGRYLPEFGPPAHPDPARPGGFHLWNGYYQAVDADVLYAMIRHLKPRRVLEIGSGYSTLVTAAAIARNRAEGQDCEFTAVDPDPRIAGAAGPEGPARVLALPAQELPLETFLELRRGDVLFVDGSHTVKLGSDTNFLVLEVLPRLRAGVVVHFHDIFLPYEYPRAWYERGTFLAENHLLHAFLIGNASYEVLFAAHAVSRAHRERLAELIPLARGRADHYPAAFWIVRATEPVAPGTGEQS